MNFIYFFPRILCGFDFVVFIEHWKSRCVVKVMSSRGNKIIEKNLNSKKLKLDVLPNKAIDYIPKDLKHELLFKNMSKALFYFIKCIMYYLDVRDAVDGNNYYN